MKKNLLFVLLLITQVAHSQLIDDFKDGDFTINPIWKSSNNDTDFIIINNRLRSNSIIASNSFSISTENTLSLNVKWEFLINLQFNTSGSNYVDVYLISDKADLKNSQINGYFVRIGNTNDEISLYKRSGTNSNIIKIVDGIDGVTNLGNSVLKIRVTRSQEGLFTLERDLGGIGNAFFTEGSVLDRDFLHSNYFGIFIQQSTASFFQKHFFDDFLIESLVSDKSPPELLSASAIDSNLLEIEFNEGMDSLGMQNPQNFTLKNYSGNLKLTESYENAKKFKFKLSTSLNTGNYSIEVSNLKDKSGNIITDKNSADFYYKKPYVPKIGDIVINEIFADPSPQIDLPSVEFIELFNKSDEAIDLHNWKIGDGSSSGLLREIIIEPQSYLILSAKSDTAEFKKYGKVLGVSPWPTLSNTGKEIKLRNQFNLTIDSVFYVNSWHSDSNKKQGGWTLERISPTSQCPAFLNWSSSIDSTGGSPGRQNSIFIANFEKIAFRADSIRYLSDSTLTILFNKPLNINNLNKNYFELIPFSGELKDIKASQNLKQIFLSFSEKFKSGTNYELKINHLKDCNSNLIVSPTKLPFKTPEAPIPPPIKIDSAQLIITEIFADPSPEIELPLVEFIEIYNPGLDTVNLEGWTINDPQTRGVFKKHLLPPNSYLILCPLADTVQFKKYGKTLGVFPWPSLKNNGDEIILKSFKNRTVDSLNYSESWYKDSKKVSGGWTLEKINLNNSTCSNFYNWAASIDKSGGSPGRQNSRYKPQYLNLDLKIDSVRIISENSIDLFFNQIPDSNYLKKSNFKLNTSSNKVRNIEIAASWESLRLIFEEKFNEGEKYSLMADSLYSCSGNLIKTENSTKNFEIPSIPEIEYPIIINEIFADPSPQIGLPDAEFVELFNPTDKSIPLKGLAFGKSPAFKEGEIEAGAYLILCAERDTLSFSEHGKVIGLANWTGISNLKDSIQLRNNKGRVIHQVNYSSLWHRDKGKRQGGYSLELIDYQSTCPNFQNWISSIDSLGGTPGRKNSVYHQNRSSEPLKLIEIEMLDSMSLAIDFNREIGSLKASFTNNYNINNGVGNPMSASINGVNFNQIILKFSQPLTRGQNYRLVINNLADCADNTISTDFNFKDFHLAPKIQKEDVLLNEILFNPKPGGADFVEIYNNAVHSIDLKELKIAQITKDSLHSIREISKKQFLLEPGKYLALSINPENIKKEYQVIDENNIHKMLSMPVFNDDEGTSVLLSEGRIIDQMNYSEKMHFPLLKNVEGVSLERSKFNRPANENGNLRSATMASGGATPGYKNSQYIDEQSIKEEDISITKTFSPNNDGFEDVFELNYRTIKAGEIANINIFNDRGLLIKKLVKNYTLNSEGNLIWDGMNEYGQMSPIGIYIIHVEIFNLDGQIKRFRKSFALVSKFK